MRYAINVLNYTLSIYLINIVCLQIIKNKFKKEKNNFIWRLKRMGQY